MHEFSVAKQIVSEVLKVAEEEKASSVNEVKLEVGKLSHLNGSQLKFCFNSLIKEYDLLKNTNLVIKEKEIVISCDCGFNGVVGEGECNLSSLASQLKCPSCGDLSPSIESGKEILVRNIEVLRENDEEGFN